MGGDASAKAADAGWFPDPAGRYEQRYWTGEAWSEHVHRGGERAVDPLEKVAPASVAIAAGSLIPRVPAEPLPSQVPLKKIPFWGARDVARSYQAENERLAGLIAQYGLLEVAERDRLTREAEAREFAARESLSSVHADIARVEAERDRVKSEIVDLRATTALQDLSIFDFEHPAESSVSLATDLASLRAAIKSAASSGQATDATNSFTYNNSKAKGEKFVRDMSRLMLRSYNAEAENCVKTVRAGNLDAAQKRLGTTVTQVERLGKMIDLRITPYYHGLRLRELELASRHLQAVQAERELERERREELRQQKQAELELAREKEKLAKERQHCENVLQTLLAKGDVEGAERMRERLEDVEKAIENVDYRAANIRAGYVYVISNVGSFGPDVVKIGMTRRLDPMDRVTELGDASVPFRFDVHALFYADDAVKVEGLLHRHFADRRLNKVNFRREYFQATPAEVLDALREHQVEVLEYVLEPAALEYRTSLAAIGPVG